MYKSKNPYQTEHCFRKLNRVNVRKYCETEYAVFKVQNQELGTIHIIMLERKRQKEIF